MRNQRVIKKETITYIDVLRIYYYPDLTFAEVLDKVVSQFERHYHLKKKLLDE